MQAKVFLAQSTGKKTDSASVAEYLKEKIKWSSQKRIPSKETVEHLLSIGQMLARSVRAQVAVERAKVRFGRQTLFDEPAKLLVLVQKSSNLVEFEFLVEGFFAFMARYPECQQSLAELRNKAGDLQTLLFTRRIFMFLLKKYPIAASSPDQQQVGAIMQSPVVWLDTCFEVRAVELAWVAGLPEAAQLLLGHVRGVLEGRLNEPMKGMLGFPPATGASPEAFLKIEKVKTQFVEPMETTGQQS